MIRRLQPPARVSSGRRTHKALGVAMVVCLSAGLGVVSTTTPAGAWFPFVCFQPSSTVYIINNAPAPYNTIAVKSAAAWRFAGSRVNVQMVPPGTWTINNYSAFAWGATQRDGIVTWPNSPNPCPLPARLYSSPTNAWLNRSYTDAYVDQARQSVNVHEFGHMLGLAHNPTVNPGGPLNCGTTVVMNPSTDRWYQCSVNTPQADDRAGVNALY